MSFETEVTEGGKILLVDDDAAMRRALRNTLSTIGFAVVEAARGEEAISLIRVHRFDAVILDVDMPGMGGVETCRTIRRSAPNMPILMLTVLDGEEDKVTALESGADDYITKPFQLRETIARIRSAVRRRSFKGPDRKSPLQFGGIELDPDKYRVTRRGKSVRLTPKEFELLYYLMRNAGQPIPHSRLLKAIWGPEYGNEVEYLRTFVRNLRKKLEDDPGNPKYILTDAYFGYRFDEHAS